jgi:Uma2 family endonuclease
VDYRAKHSEYAVLDIPEYWIVDPLAKPLCKRIDLKVTVCVLKDGAYSDEVFVSDLTIVSPTFPELGLKALEVLNASR